LRAPDLNAYRDPISRLPKWHIRNHLDAPLCRPNSGFVPDQELKTTLADFAEKPPGRRCKHCERINAAQLAYPVTPQLTHKQQKPKPKPPPETLWTHDIPFYD